MSDTGGYVDTAGKLLQASEADGPVLVGDVRAAGGEPLALIVEESAQLRAGRVGSRGRGNPGTRRPCR